MEEELKQRIQELEDRVDELEDKEHKRKIFRIIKLCIKLAILGLIFFGIYRLYSFVNDTYIKPLNNIIEDSEEIKNSLDFSSISDWIKSFK